MLPAITALPPLTVSPPISGITNPSSASAATAAGGGFAQMMSDLASSSVQTLGRAETTSISALQGKASLQQVVDSITAAEQTLQTVIAVRDKAVSAWQDMSHMAI